MTPDYLAQLQPHPTDSLQRSPEALFLKIVTIFRELDILGRALSLEHDGVWYRIVCDENAFMVYRVNVHTGSSHHIPGWPVCLVNSVTIFEECHSPDLGRDHFACGLDAETWLELVGSHFRNSPDL